MVTFRAWLGEQEHRQDHVGALAQFWAQITPGRISSADGITQYLSGLAEQARWEKTLESAGAPPNAHWQDALAAARAEYQNQRIDAAKAAPETPGGLPDQPKVREENPGTPPHAPDGPQTPAQPPADVPGPTPPPWAEPVSRAPAAPAGGGLTWLQTGITGIITELAGIRAHLGSIANELAENRSRQDHQRRPGELDWAALYDTTCASWIADTSGPRSR